MGLFQRKQQPKDKPPIDETSDGIQQFFDGYFAELRTRGREQFEKSVEAALTEFKQDLDAVVAKTNAELKEYITGRLDEQIAANNEVMKHGQEQVLQSLTASANGLKEQHTQLSQQLQKSVTEQQALLATAFDENKAQLVAMQEAQTAALKWLTESAQAMQEQQQQIAATLQKNVLAQEESLVTGFEQNMAQIVEHYLLGALGDQYDLKTQLPSIIKQMEANKQDLMDDMKL